MGHHVDYLITHFGYFGIIIALIGGIIGLPIPDEVLLTYVGYNVFHGRMAYIPSILSGFTGAAGGITLSFLLGLKLGLPFLRKFGPKFHMNEEKISRTKKLFNKLGPFLLFIGYFIPGVRHLTAYLAGMNGFSYKKFALFAYAGALIWCSTFITIGRTLGEKWKDVIFYLDRYRLFIIPIVIVLVVSLFIFWRKQRNESKSREAYND